LLYTTFLKVYADGATASESEIPRIWETWLLILTMPLSSCDYSRQGALERNRKGNDTIRPLPAPIMVMLFLLHKKSDALQLCRRSHEYKQEISHGNFSGDQFPQMQNGHNNT